MADQSTISQPLLSATKNSSPSSTLAILVKWVLKSLMWALFLIWVLVTVLYPTHFISSFVLRKWIVLTEGSVYGITGSIFLGFSGPILIIALLAYVYLAFFKRDGFEKKKKGKFPRFRLWTFPVLIDGPFGVVSAVELIGIVLFVAFVLWSVSLYVIETCDLGVKSSLPSSEMLAIIGLRFGMIGMLCLPFLFIPVARGSILLRLIDIPFEHAAKYHVWLGHLTMALFTFHGVFYVIAWSMEGRLLRKLSEWADIGIANLPGVISLAAGLLMWVTSLGPVRVKFFELFFYTHQLYIIFIVFLAMHVGDFIFSMCAGAIYLFILDRFLRFCQSRTSVDIISASCRPCGTVELTLSKPPNLPYNALSFIFLQVRECSWLQWHPFSVSSSPLDGDRHMSVLIKVLGKWTEKLRDMTLNAPEKTQNIPIKSMQITASVEGPYGHEWPYYLTYENLVLVAGGIGISPFIAILSDILHRIKEGKPCSPKNVLVVWAVKKSNELSLISAVNAQPISSTNSDKLHLDIQAYVTQESEPSLEDGRLDGGQMHACPFSTVTGNSMSCLVGTGNVWSGIYFTITFLGFVVLFGLMEVYYIVPFNITAWWLKGLLLLTTMVMSVVLLGGPVIFFWNLWEKKSLNNERGIFDENSNSVQNDGQDLHNDEASKADLASLLTTQYGHRPNFDAIFNSFGESVGRADVGVIVCGPSTLQSSVARACRSQNIRGKWNQAVFHFNSHSFDL